MVDRLEGKICAVTGATGALGKALSVELAKRGAQVVMISRDGARLRAAADEVRTASGSSTVEVRTCDLSSLASVRECAEEMHSLHHKLHVLVNNAAIYSKERRVSADGFEMMFATNQLGPFLLTNLLLPSLKAAAPSRVITVSAPSSTELDFADLQGEREFKSLHAFGASKSANLLFANALARRLSGTQVTSNAVHPGLMKSELMHDMPFLKGLLNLFSKKPSVAAGRIGELAASAAFATTSGTFIKGTSPGKAPAYSLQTETQEKLWTVCADLVGHSA
jgi:retinol dehydrogenase-12